MSIALDKKNLTQGEELWSTLQLILGKTIFENNRMYVKYTGILKL